MTKRRQSVGPMRPKSTRRVAPYARAPTAAYCSCGKPLNARGECTGHEMCENSVPSRSRPAQEPIFTEDDPKRLNASGITNTLQASGCPVIELPAISSVTSVSSNSLQIDPAFACRCSECLAYNNRKAKRTKDRCSGYSRSCSGGFCCDKLVRHQSTSGMGRDDADKPYIADRYRLNYGSLTLLDVSYFAPKFGFQSLKK